MTWPQVDLEEIADVSAGNPAPQDASHFCVDGHPFVRMQDVGRKHIDPALVQTTDRVSPRGIRECGLRLYPAGTLLVPKSGASVNLNHRAMLGRDAYVVSHLATIIPDQRKVLPSYLFHWSQRYDPRSQAQVTSLPSLPLSLIKAAKVPLPPVEEQRRIVALLDRAAEIKRRAEAAHAKACATIPALFFDLFGDPATNPKGWPVRRLGETADFFGGASLPAGIPFTGQEGGYLHCKVSTLSLPENTDGIVRSVEWSVQPSARSAVAPPGSILFPKRGAAIATNKKRLLLRVGALDPNLMAVRGKSESYTPGFLLALFDAFDLMSIASGSTVPQLNKQDLSPLQNIVPPLSLQIAFAEQAQRIGATARALNSAAAKAESMAAALSAQVFGAP